MNNDRSIFSQIMDLLSRHEFNQCVERYRETATPRTFSHYDQFLSMAFAQLTFRESLRDIEVCLAALGTRTYHMGFRSRMTRSTLAYANNTRDWRIWQDLAHILIRRAKTLYAQDELAVELDNAVYALDSTIISLCLSLFPWARHQTNQRAIKIHTQLDLRGNIPSFALISHANMSDVRFLDDILIEPGATYVMDRGYFDFKRLYRFTSVGAFFVTRLKRNVSYRRTQIFSRSKTDTIRIDAAIKPLSRKARKHYPQHIRLVAYFDAEHKKLFFFLTNNFFLPAHTIADLYKARWQIELFFKWIKQHLRIKSFFGTSENAVKSQIWIAITVYVLVAILKKELRLTHSLHTILQILSIGAVEKMPILQAFQQFRTQENIHTESNQLNLFGIPIGH